MSLFYAGTLIEKIVLGQPVYSRKAPMITNNLILVYFRMISQQLAAIKEPVLDWVTGRSQEMREKVWESDLGDHPVQVWLKSDRVELRFGNRVVQSSCLRSDPYQLLLSYTRHMMLSLLLVPQPRNALHIGLGGGTVPVFLGRQFPYLHQTIIEINEAVYEAAKLYFGFEENNRTHVILADATEAVSQIDANFDLIFIDAFGPSGAPESIMDNSFLEELYERLYPGGWAVGNYWALDAFFPIQLARWRTIFPEVLQVRARPTGNMILFGMKKGKTQTLTRVNRGLKDQAGVFQRKTGLDLLKMLHNLKRVP